MEADLSFPCVVYVESQGRLQVGERAVNMAGLHPRRVAAFLNQQINRRAVGGEQG